MGRMLSPEVKGMSVRLAKVEKLISAETGEVKNAITFIPEAKDRDFAKVFKLFSSKVLEDLGGMRGEQTFLLWMLAMTVDQPVNSDGYLPVYPDEVGKAIGKDPRSVKNYLSRLKALGYIEQHRPRSPMWRVKPELVYRGTLVEYWKKTSEPQKKLRTKKN